MEMWLCPLSTRENSVIGGAGLFVWGILSSSFLHLAVRPRKRAWVWGGRGKSGYGMGGFVPVLGVGAVVLWSVIGCALLFLGWWWFGPLGDKRGYLVCPCQRRVAVFGIFDFPGEEQDISLTGVEVVLCVVLGGPVNV